MSFADTAGVVRILEKANAELEAVGRATESEIRAVAKTFEDLTSYTDSILQLTAAIVASVESESVSSVLPTLRSLATIAKHFIGERLEATAGILEIVTTEVKLLEQLSQVTRDQAVIARKTKALSVLSNIEVAHLGSAGDSFEYLACQLTEFSQSLTNDIQELARHTDARSAAIKETKLMLSAELPRQREALAGIELDLANALTVAESGLTRLATTPEQFRTGVNDLAQQIAGVVAAIQAHDITRQQLEHVREALSLISARLRGNDARKNGIAEDLPWACAGLTIQIYQLRTVKQIVASWATQIKTCMNGILTVSASEVIGIGPMVLKQEQEVSAQLGRIEELQQAMAYGDGVRNSLKGLTTLMQLVTEHLRKSKSVRESLQLLTFNSIIQATHLGTRANAILAIARNIEKISNAWEEITLQCSVAMQEITQLVERTDRLMEAFSDASSQGLRKAQLQTGTRLDNLRCTSAVAAGIAEALTAVTERMHAKIASVETGDLFEACLSRFDAVLVEVERAQRELETSNAKENYDAAEVMRSFSAFYSTEMERAVLNAVLRGAPLPAAQQTFGGNSVEIF